MAVSRGTSFKYKIIVPTSAGLAAAQVSAANMDQCAPTRWNSMPVAYLTIFWGLHVA